MKKLIITTALLLTPLFLSATQTNKTFGQIVAHNHLWWINKIKLLDPPLTISAGLTILLFIILLWPTKLYPHKSYQHKKIKSNKEQEIESEDIMSTKLDLARAYIDMGEYERVKGILKNVLQNGSTAQKMEANILLKETR